MTSSRKQHELAVTLLNALGLQYLRLERRPDGSYHYHGWTTPLVDGNGSPRISRRGVIRRSQVR